MNFGVIFQEIGAVAGELAIATGELAAGQEVQVPLEPQIGTVGGKPVYLKATLSTSKGTPHPSPVTSSGILEVPLS